MIMVTRDKVSGARFHANGSGAVDSVIVPLIQQLRNHPRLPTPGHRLCFASMLAAKLTQLDRLGHGHNVKVCEFTFFTAVDD